jgi:hypothetical protein
MRNTIRENARYKIGHQITEKQSLSLFEKPDAAKLGDKQKKLLDLVRLRDV